MPPPPSSSSASSVAALSVEANRDNHRSEHDGAPVPSGLAATVWEAASEASDGPVRTQQTPNLRQNWFSLTFVDAETNARHRASSLEPKFTFSLLFALFVGWRDFFALDHSDVHNQTGDWVLQSAAFARVYFPLITGAIYLILRWHTFGRRLSPWAVHAFDAATALFLCGVPVAESVLAAFRGLPPPCAIVSVAGGAIITGLPWYYHGLGAGVSFLCFVLAIAAYRRPADEPDDDGELDRRLYELVNSIGRSLVTMVVMSYFCDKALRAEFATREHLRTFRRQLDEVVSHMHGSHAQAHANAHDAHGHHHARKKNDNKKEAIA